MSCDFKLKHIKIKVHPDSKEESIVSLKEDVFEVYLREPAEEGLANKRLMTLISENITPKPKRIRIVSGHLSHSKTIEVEYE